MSDIIPNLVSTVIPVYNRPEMLRQAVDSVLAQTYRPIEIIIADDGSTDETPEMGQRLAAQSGGVIVYTAHENAGPGLTRELGRRVASGEFLQYLDSDDRLLPNKFADQVAVLRNHPECDIAYGITRLVDAQGKTLVDPFKWTDRQIATLFPGLLVDRWWCTHTPLYRRTLTDRIGTWCDMRWSQDWEYDARAGAMQVKLVNCNTHVSEHVHHEGLRQTSAADWFTDPVRIRNRLQLLEALWRGAQATGVAASSPERQHFARWCFMIARNASVQGMAAEADRCLALAGAAAANGPGRRGLSAYRLSTRSLGHVLTGTLCQKIAALQNRPSETTQKQSFAK